MPAAVSSANMHQQGSLEAPFVDAGSVPQPRMYRPATKIIFVTMAVVGIAMVAFFGGDDVAQPLETVSPVQDASHLEELKPEPFEEEPAKGFLTVQQQWYTIIGFWVIFIIWYPIFCLEVFSSDTKAGFFVNTIFPILLLPLIGIPSACAMINYEVPVAGYACAAAMMLTPFLCYRYKCLALFLIGCMGAFPMSFCFFAIHRANFADTSNETFNWTAQFCQPYGLAIMNAGLYKWQFWPKFPLSNKVRWALLGYLGIKYMKEALVEVIKQSMGHTAYDPNEFSTYKITPVQYIRMNSIRVIVVMCCFFYMKLLEELAFPKQKCEIAKGRYEPFTKIVPVSPF